MASGITNHGKWMFLESTFKNTNPVDSGTHFILILVDAGATPSADDGLWSQWLTTGFAEIAAGNGYTAGGSTEGDLTRDATGFDSSTENDTDNRGEIQAKDVAWTASGGPIPSSGPGASYAVLTDDNVTIGSREVFAWFDLTGPHTLSAGSTLTIQNAEIRVS
jgi:hypothetical protein